MKAIVPAQECRFCGCTADHPRKLANGDECMFLTARADRCNAPECVKAWEDEGYRAERRDFSYRQVVRAMREKSGAGKRRKMRRQAA